METLTIARELEKVGIEQDNAYKIAETINGNSGLATKEDLANVKAELKEEISEVKSELKEDIAGVRADIKWIMGIMLMGMGVLSSGMIAILIAIFSK